MTVTRTTSITDPDHLVTYQDTGGVSRTTSRSIEVRVFAPDAPGNYHVILYSHGMGGSPFANSANVAAALATMGYIVIAPTHLDSFRTSAQIQDDFYGQPGIAAVHRVADMQFLLDNVATVTGGLSGYGVNLSDVTIAGHSLGAYTAQLLTGVASSLPELSSLAAVNPYGISSVSDARFKQAILLSPQGVPANSSGTFGLNDSSWDVQTAPTLTVTGTLDSGFDNQDYRDRLYGLDHAPSTGKHGIVISGADHGQIGGDTSVPAINTEVNAAMSLFLQAYVGNSASALGTLSNVSTYQTAHSLVSEAYVRSGDDFHGVVAGTSSGDVMIGQSTRDRLFGGLGNDMLDGGFGADTLDGGAGNDQLTGGGGSDLFRYSGGGNLGNDVITDFNVWVAQPAGIDNRACNDLPRRMATSSSGQSDYIDLRTTGYTATSLGRSISVSAVGSDTLISFLSGPLAGTSIKLLSVANSTIDSGDFLF